MTFDEVKQKLGRSEAKRIERLILQSVLDDKDGLEWADTEPAPEKEEEKTAE
jgi:hypothetical protein